MADPIKEMKSAQNTELIEVDKGVVLEAIDKEGKYTTPGVLIRKWEGEEGLESFLCEIDKNNTRYVGVLNNKFQRDNIGLYVYENGEKYFGSFIANIRERHGIYFWPPIKTGKMIENEMYYGFWKGNKKESQGIYLWIKEEEGNEIFEEADFDAYIGKIENETYSKGSYLTKKGDNYFLYYGNFKADGTKNDTDAYYYSATTDRLIKGSIENNLFKSGYIGFFSLENGDLTDLVYATFNDDGTIKELKHKDDIDPVKYEEIANDLEVFRSVILDKDYFGDLYTKYKDITKVVKNDMNTSKIYDDKDKFPTLLMLCTAYNELNISQHIERKAKKPNTTSTTN